MLTELEHKINGFTTMEKENMPGKQAILTEEIVWVCQTLNKLQLHLEPQTLAIFTLTCGKEHDHNHHYSCATTTHLILGSLTGSTLH